MFNSDDFGNIDIEGFGNTINPDVLLLQEVRSADLLDDIKSEMDRSGHHSVISSFDRGEGTREVAIISRFPLTDVVEYDPTPEGAGDGMSFAEQPLDHINVPGISDVNVGRGFLVARIPALEVIVVNTHLKSSQKKSGRADRKNAQKRELVAAAMATVVADLIEDYPDHTVIVGGDFNVGIHDVRKNGTDLTTDNTRGSGDRYDETHAIFGNGLIAGLRMMERCAGMGGTYVGDDNDPDFPQAGAIDVFYVDGAHPGEFSRGERATDSFGSDHLAVSIEMGSGVIPPPPLSTDVRITRILPNPDGRDRGNETITIRNFDSDGVSIVGWRFVDRGGNEFQISFSSLLEAGQELTLRMENFEMPLNNSGDEIYLFDRSGTIRDHVSYPGSQVEEGEVIEFD